MFRQAYVLSADRSKLLKVSWNWGWRHLVLRLNGEIVGAIPHPRSLRKGQQFVLEDGLRLKIRLVYWGTISLGVKVFLNERILTPVKYLSPYLAITTLIIFLISGTNFWVGLLLASDGSLNNFSYLIIFTSFVGAAAWSNPIVLFIISGIYLLLGFFTWRGSPLALAIALGLFVLDTLWITLLGGSSEAAAHTMLLFSIHLFPILAMAVGFEGFYQPDSNSLDNANNQTDLEQLVEPQKSLISRSFGVLLKIFYYLLLIVEILTAILSGIGG